MSMSMVDHVSFFVEISDMMCMYTLSQKHQVLAYYIVYYFMRIVLT